MRHTRFSTLHYAIPLTLLAVGALMLLPGQDRPERASTISEVAPRSTPSYLAASPELVAEIDASLRPAEVDEPVVRREASLPDPTAIPSNALARPSAEQPAALATAAAPETSDDNPAVNPASAIRVGDTAVNMRVGPSTSTSVIRALQAGESLAYGESDGGWVSVTTESGETGWVYGSYLTGPGLPDRQTNSVPAREVAQASRQTPASDGHYARVGSDVYLRAGPSPSTERLFVLPAGERVQIAERRGGWARVVLPSGASGWVRVR